METLRRAINCGVDLGSTTAVGDRRYNRTRKCLCRSVYNKIQRDSMNRGDIDRRIFAANARRDKGHGLLSVTGKRKNGFAGRG